jgi:hypothetical protein
MRKLNMKRLGVAAALLVMASTAQAQTGCPASTAGASAQNAARDLCLQSQDVFQLLAPQLGISITGGNSTLGQGGTLGGLGHFAVEARGNVVMGDFPDISNWPAPRTSTPTAQVLPSKNQIVGLPIVDGAIGLFKGLPLGLTNVGGVDLLLSAAYVPTLDKSKVSITPDQNLKIGYGIRVGALQESLLVPGVSFSYIKRDLPTTTITASDANFGSFTLSDAAIKTSSWRIVASKSLILFGVAAGVGQDKYDESASFAGTANTGLLLQPTQSFGPFALKQDMTRTNYFVDLSLNLLVLKLVGEVGQVSGGTLSPTPFNTFSTGAANDSRTYASVGARFGW